MKATMVLILTQTMSSFLNLSKKFWCPNPTKLRPFHINACFSSTPVAGHSPTVISVISGAIGKYSAVWGHIVSYICAAAVALNAGVRWCESNTTVIPSAMWDTYWQTVKWKHSTHSLRNKSVWTIRMRFPLMDTCRGCSATTSVC